MPPVAHNADAAAARERLAADLEARGLRATMVERMSGPLRLKVTNPAATALSETVIVHAGTFWWPWRDPIGPASDAAAAAEIIARVLATAAPAHTE